MDSECNILTFPNRDAWLDARRCYICASDIPLLMGSEKHRSWRLADDPGIEPVVSLWREKVQGRKVDTPSIHARMGTALEALVLELYGETTGNKVHRSYSTGFGLHVRIAAHNDKRRPQWAASLDAEAVNKKTAEEIAVEAKTGMYGRGNWTMAYDWQCQWQMMVTGHRRVDLACLQKAKGEFHVETIEHDPRKEARMLEVASEFATFVQDGKEPPQSWVDRQIAGF